MGTSSPHTYGLPVELLESFKKLCSDRRRNIKEKKMAGLNDDPPKFYELVELVNGVNKVLLEKPYKKIEVAVLVDRGTGQTVLNFYKAKLDRSKNLPRNTEWWLRDGLNMAFFLTRYVEVKESESDLNVEDSDGRIKPVHARKIRLVNTSEKKNPNCVEMSLDFYGDDCTEFCERIREKIQEARDKSLSSEEEDQMSTTESE